nr:MAG TPA: hypothetical protein [Caudoviricetes sp.]
MDKEKAQKTELSARVSNRLRASTLKASINGVILS